MHLTDLFEAPIPFGRKMPTNGMTFGFEAELVIKATCYYDEVDLYDFSDEDELMEELGCDEERTKEEFELWREDQEDGDDKTLLDWIDDIGEAKFWEESRAGNWFYKLHGDEIIQVVSWARAAENFSEDFEEEFNTKVLVARDSETPIEHKDYSNWYLEPDPSIEGSSEGWSMESSDHGVELISPIIGDYAAFKGSIQKVFNWLHERFQGDVFTNASTGFHVNIGFPGRTIDPLKLLLFSGEKWMKSAFGRENNQHTNSLLAQLNHDGLPRSPEAAQNILNALLKDSNEKHWVINLKTLAERGYVEFRPIGNHDYDKRWPEIEQHMDRFIQLMHIASDPQMFRKEYQKKLGKFILGDQPVQHLSTQVRAVLNWMDGIKLAPSSRARLIDDSGQIVANPESLFQIVGLIEAHYQEHRMPDVVLKTLIRASGLDKAYAELCRQYDIRIPYGSNEETYAAARARLDPLLAR